MSISTGTGVGTSIGNMGIGTAPALSVNPLNGNLYAGTGGSTNNLYLINTSNAGSTLMGGGALGDAGYGGFDFDSSGVLYGTANIAGGAGSGSDHLVTINTANGLATLVGSFGTCTGITFPVPPSGGTGTCTIEGIEAIAFDNAGNLWGVENERGDAGTPGLYTVNKITGTAAFVTAIDDAAAGLHPSGGVVTIQFACDGTLYAGTARRQGAANNDGGKLGTINTVSGLFTFISASPITSGSPANSLGGLAFGSTCPTPTPSPSPSPSPSPTPSPSPSPSPTPGTGTPTPTLNPAVGGVVEIVTGSGGSSDGGVSLPMVSLLALIGAGFVAITGTALTLSRRRA